MNIKSTTKCSGKMTQLDFFFNSVEVFVQIQSFNLKDNFAANVQ